MDLVVYTFVSVLLASFGLAICRRRRRRKRITRKIWVRPWLRRRDSPRYHNVMHLHKELLLDGDVQEFRATLRMPPNVYNELLEELKPALTKRHTNFRKPISPEARLALTMRFLALGEGFRSLSQHFRVGLSTTRLIVRETCQAVTSILGKTYLRTPTTRDGWMKLARDFEMRWNFPHCIGAVDGKHIRIIAPRNSGSYFHNYKDFFSIVLMAVVNDDYQFIYVDIGAEGKASDGGIWSKCSLSQHMQDSTNPLAIPEPQRIPGIPERIPYFLVGDEAFRLGPNLLKPFPSTGLTKRQQIYNYRLSRCRRIVENAFRILSCRFKVFRRTIEVNPDFMTDIVMASCVLHNYMRQQARNDYLPPTSIDHELDDGEIVPGAWRQEIGLPSMHKNPQKNASEYAKRIRNHMADYFLTKRGELEWQYKSAIL